MGAAFPTRNMGSWLREALGEGYFALGLVGYYVEVDWPPFLGGLLTPPRGFLNVEYRLHYEIGRDYLLVDLAFPGTDEPFLRDLQTYTLNGWSLVPAEQFSALFYLDFSPAMDALRW